MPYVELHAHSAYSFLDGASLPEELAAAAAELGHSALALTDHDGLWGQMEHAQACNGLGIKPICGAEMTVTDDPGSAGAAPSAFHLTLLVESAQGWRNLCRLTTMAHAGTRPDPPRGDPLPPAISLTELEQHSDGLVCLSGCAERGGMARELGEPGTRSNVRESRARAEALGRRLLKTFGPDRFRVELQRPYWRRDRNRNRVLAGLAERLEVPTIATGNVHSHHPRRTLLQDTLVSIRLGGTLEQTEPQRRGNRTSVLLSPEQMAERFADHPEAISETGRLAERLNFDLTRDLGYRYPGSEDPDADRNLAEVCAERFGERYDGTPHKAEAAARLEEELRVIRKLGLSGFFLLHRDMLELAREVAYEVRGRGSIRALLPPGRGRGSSVSSIVCYLTGLSHVDPVKGGLFLGRFLNDEISAAPDIDLDFPRDIREVLIPRVHERYGKDRSALVAAFSTYKSRGAIREVGKALGLPPGEIERVAKAVDIYGGAESVRAEIGAAIGEGRASSERWRALAWLAREAYGLPRHVSQHPGGMVLSTRPLIDLCPIQPAAMEGRQMVQWDKDSCADAGFLKIDLLGLGMLSAVERCVVEVERVRGERIDLSRIPLDDEDVFRSIRAAETTGVFQIESRAQMQMLPRTRPENLDDLVVQVALVRPGPIQGGAVHPYIERRKALRADPNYEIPYDHPSLEPCLRDTLGAIVFQDQVIQVAMALAGFSAGEAEGLRRAMSRRRSAEALRAYRVRFIEGAAERGVDEALADRIFDQVQGFSGFGFPKAHSAAFALLAYQSTWLRYHYGPEFLCALLNEQPMGFYAPDALVHEAQRRGFELRPPEVAHSALECRVEPLAQHVNGLGSTLAAKPQDGTANPSGGLAVRIGLGYIAGLAEDDARAVIEERERSGPFSGLADLASRAGIGDGALRLLAWSGSCDSLVGIDSALTDPKARGDQRRKALWQLGITAGSTGSSIGTTQLSLPLELPPTPRLDQLDEWDKTVADYETTGITLGRHPMALIRERIAPASWTTTDQLEALPDETPMKIAGMVVARQRPETAKGVMFMLLEDEHGMANLVILPPVYEQYRPIARGAAFILARGKLERRDRVINILVSSLERISAPDQPQATVHPIHKPQPVAQPETDKGAIANLAAALPPSHSFGRRGR